MATRLSTRRRNDARASFRRFGWQASVVPGKVSLIEPESSASGFLFLAPRSLRVPLFFLSLIVETPLFSSALQTVEMTVETNGQGRTHLEACYNLRMKSKASIPDPHEVYAMHPPIVQDVRDVVPTAWYAVMYCGAYSILPLVGSEIPPPLMFKISVAGEDLPNKS
ncbi:hypothetical protein N7539_003705 [Penicillium diatomitis]|uniref:Uncharacterized protein n=1 Tax=Penicillium diatomitis TaxID=2819901 RepID=A0A9X0BXJ6_9EURO|nr:uncharacterized protein N7539_003705 [Penicillium diatomitis]KAJ5488815.1 hypothetical protein N7539_003705 [Penicillium diatomitis]